ncbi:MAG: hypothetical protein EOM20_05390 [Spartobacteria bacterium]|nr:hypothetical protein [Spartobacteria bacterium]
MSLKSQFKSAVRELHKREVMFAVAGGLAADLYRHEPRLTMDVDLVILTEDKAPETATSVLRAIGLGVGIVRQADLDGGPLFAIRRKSTPPCMVVGRAAGGEGVDILLPEIPWVSQAVLRAQDNLVDFGFGKIPALTAEDVIIAKLYTLRSAHMRAKDLDDLQSIFAADPEMDVPYLAGQIGRLGLTVPKAAKPFLPAELLKTVSDISRSKKAERQNRPG